MLAKAGQAPWAPIVSERSYKSVGQSTRGKTLMDQGEDVADSRQLAAAAAAAAALLPDGEPKAAAATSVVVRLPGGDTGRNRRAARRTCEALGHR